MEDWIGKTCPYCKTEFKEGDSIQACPACGRLHHSECWGKNSGCSAPGCPQQKDAPRPSADRLPNQEVPPEPAGSPPPQDQTPDQGLPGVPTQPAGAPSAAAAVSTPQREGPNPSNVCANCKTILKDGQAFCPSCGQKSGLISNPEKRDAVEPHDVAVKKKVKLKKQVPILIGVVVVLAAAVGIYLFQSMRAKQLEEAKAAYLADAVSFVSLSYSAGVNLEDIADTVQQYWYDSIWYDMYQADIDVAIQTALSDKSTELYTALDHFAQMQILYGRLKTLPDRVEDRYFEDVCDAVKTMYNVYTSYYTFATDPSGNYNSFNADNKSKTDGYIAAYNALDNLLDSNG